jgi:hypothetical protein
MDREMLFANLAAGPFVGLCRLGDYPLGKM